jgi:hypothetical protein
MVTALKAFRSEFPNAPFWTSANDVGCARLNAVTWVRAKRRCPGTPLRAHRRQGRPTDRRRPFLFQVGAASARVRRPISLRNGENYVVPVRNGLRACPQTVPLTRRLLAAADPWTCRYARHAMTVGGYVTMTDVTAAIGFFWRKNVDPAKTSGASGGRARQSVRRRSGEDDLFMTSDEHLLKLVRQALDDFETAELPASCRRAFRVAHLLGHSKDSWFFRMDLRPRGGAIELREAETLALFRDQEMAAARDAHSALLEIWMKERQPTIHEFFNDWAKGTLLVGSIGELQRSQQHMELEVSREPDLVQRLKLEARGDMDVEVLERIRARTFAYLCRVETDMSVAVITERIFERHRARVDLLLREVASDVLERFTAAYRRAAEGDTEARSQALTSCRRILQAGVLRHECG